VKGDDHTIAFEMKDFKTSDSVFEIVGVWANYDDVWYPIYMGSGTIDYDGLEHRPQINSVTLTGNKTTRDLGMIEEITQAAYDLLPSADKNNPDKVYYIKDAGGSGGGGGGGSSTLAGLTDVDLSSPTNGQVLEYDSTDQVWKNATPSSGGGSSYSTTEQVVGTWIDGKPIYRIVLDYHSAPLSGNKSVDVTALDIDTLVWTNALGTDNSNGYSGTKWSLNSVSANSSRLIYMSNATTLKVEGSFYKHWIILEYTKTTDTANS
jgi:hypothetical protein